MSIILNILALWGCAQLPFFAYFDRKVEKLKSNYGDKKKELKNAVENQ